MTICSNRLALGRGLAFALVLVAFASACAGAPDAQASTATLDGAEATGSTTSDLRVPTLPASRLTLLAADALVANDTSLRGVTGFVSHLADDGILLARRQNLLQGKAAITSYLTGATSPIPVGGTLGWRYVRGDVSALGDFGYTLGWLEIVGPQDAAGNATVTYSVYNAIWQRSLTGEWKITVFSKTDLGSAPAAPPPTLLPLTDDGPVYPTLKGDVATANALLGMDRDFSTYTGRVGRQIGFDAYVDENGISIDDPLLFGRKAIFDSNAGIPTTSTLAWAPLLARASRSGDLGFTLGTYESGSLNAAGEHQVGYGKYLTVWKRTADGSFKYVVDGGSSSPAPTPSP